MFHFERVILNSEDHEIFFIEFSCPRKEREFYTEFIKNEIDFIDVKKVCLIIVKTTRYSLVSLVVQ